MSTKQLLGEERARVRAQAVEHYLAGKTLHAVAAAIGRTRSTTYLLLKEAQVPMRPAGNPNKKERHG